MSQQELTFNDFMAGIQEHLNQTRAESNDTITRLKKLRVNLAPSFKDSKNLDISVFYDRLGSILESEKGVIMYIDMAETRLKNIIETQAKLAKKATSP